MLKITVLFSVVFVADKSKLVHWADRGLLEKSHGPVLVYEVEKPEFDGNSIRTEMFCLALHENNVCEA